MKFFSFIEVPNVLVQATGQPLRSNELFLGRAMSIGDDQVYVQYNGGKSWIVEWCMLYVLWLMIRVCITYEYWTITHTLRRCRGYDTAEKKRPKA